MIDFCTPNAKTCRVTDVTAQVFEIPTDSPESDGTLEWESTTIVVVEANGAGKKGLGYTYGHKAVGDVVRALLADVVIGQDAMAVGSAWNAMIRSVRNVGWRGVASQAISAVDVALWDLKARILGIPVVVALDAVHCGIPVYGSGGFCSYSNHQLTDQLGSWVSSGIPRVKMKVGRNSLQDDARVKVARATIGSETELYVDANGAYSRKEALGWARRFADYGVQWLEEPVSSDDLEGLRLVRDQGPPGMDIAAGEFGYTPSYFERMLSAQAVDCLQADVTRCGGFSGFLKTGALCDARSIELSAHCAPQLSAHASCAIWHARHLEYFHDHVRVERMLFDGVIEPRQGCLVPDLGRPGLGLELKRSDADKWRVG